MNLHEKEKNRVWMFDELHCTEGLKNQTEVYEMLFGYTDNNESLEKIVASMSIANYPADSASKRALKAVTKNVWGFEENVIPVQDLSNYIN